MLTAPGTTTGLDLRAAVLAVPSEGDPLVRQVGLELQTYLQRLTGVAVPFGHGAPALALRVGDVAGTSSPDAFRVLVGASGAQLVGRTPRAVQYAAYALLEELGCAFTFGGDVLPADLAPVLPVLDLVREPLLPVRGCVPWFNFLNSPTCWELDDYRFFLDQLAKQGGSFVGFHVYDSEPFAPTADGELAWRLLNSGTYDWGAVRTLSSEQFGFGTGAVFDVGPFGAAPSREQDVPGSMAASQATLAAALRHASDRGLATAVGFETREDPTDAAAVERFRGRLRRLLELYPTLDFVSIWQPESWSAKAIVNEHWGVRRLAEDSPLKQDEALRKEFRYLGQDFRVEEGMRLAGMALHAHAALQEVAPDVRLIVGGWGGDHWLEATDFMVGLDRVLPQDVVFSMLDDIDPAAGRQVSQVYGLLSPERECWPVPWFEADGGHTGDQWGPQCHVDSFAGIVPSALSAGAAGLLGIHWRTRGVEEVAAYALRRLWREDYDAPTFWRDWARRVYGAPRADETAALLQDLEALGHRWTGGFGQAECMTFSWHADARKLPRPENLAALARIRAALAGLAATDGRSEHQRARFSRLLAMIDHVVGIDTASLPILEAERLLQAAAPQQREASIGDAQSAQTGIGAAAEEDAPACVDPADAGRRAAELLLGAGLDRGLRPLTGLLATRGDWGVLATANIKAYAQWRSDLDRAGRLIGQHLPDPQLPPLPAAVIVAEPATAHPLDEPLTVSAVVLGDDPEVALCWRRVDGQAEQRVPMVRRTGNRFTATLPADAPGGILWRVTASVAGGTPLRSLPHAVVVGVLGGAAPPSHTSTTTSTDRSTGRSTDPTTRRTP